MSKNGLILVTPTSVDHTGTSATISANGSVSFSACSVLSLNGVFSADYDNYRIVMRYKKDSGDHDVYLRLRASGTDENSASNYYTYQYVQANSTTVSAGRFSNTRTVLGTASDDQRDGLIADCYGPYLTQPTALRSICALGLNNGQLLDIATTHSLSSSYDGFSIYPASGTISGRVAVYGMRK